MSCDTLRKYAEALLERAMEVWRVILPHYDDSIRLHLTDERRDILDRADQLDTALQKLIQLSATTKDSRVLVVEMRRLRIRGLKFFVFLRLSRRLLRTMIRRINAKAELNSFDRTVTLLKIKSDLSESDLGLFEFDELVRTTPELAGSMREQLSGDNEAKLFIETLLMPLELAASERAVQQVGRTYANAIRELISTSTRTIYREQARSFAIVIWRVVQPKIVLLAVGILVAYLVHVILELLGIKFLRFNSLAVLAVLATYLGERIFEHSFAQWHLRRYRKKCRDTGLALFLAEVRARVALWGFEAVSAADPRNVEDGGEIGSPGPTNAETN